MTTSPILLHSNRLSVEIAAPGTVYQRTRFDWAGFITQVTLDGSHTFCVPEDYDPKAGTGGIGLCSEFGIEKTVGYSDAKPGETFPKLGVGLLVRPDDSAYNFFRPYEIAQPFPIHVDAGAGFARFTIELVECRGYAAREIRTVSVEGNCLQIACLLENAGSRPIITHEYCHNFIGIDRQPVGPDYELRFPYPVGFDEIQVNTDILQVQGGNIRWKATPQKPFFCRPTGFSRTGQPQWELRLASSGVGARELDDFAPSRVALWGVAHVVSAEVYTDINLQPGQSQAWTRRYEFFTGR